jgi:hypothetical protein
VECGVRKGFAVENTCVVVVSVGVVGTVREVCRGVAVSNKTSTRTRTADERRGDEGKGPSTDVGNVVGTKVVRRKDLSRLFYSTFAMPSNHRTPCTLYPVFIDRAPNLFAFRRIPSDYPSSDSYIKWPVILAT